MYTRQQPVVETSPCHRTAGAWTAFATSSKPLPPVSRTLKDVGLRQLTTWPLWTPQQQLAMRLTYPGAGQVTIDVAARCKLWDDVMDYIDANGVFARR